MTDFLTEIERLLGEATPGEWAVEPCTHLIWGPAPSDDTRTWGNPVCETKTKRGSTVEWKVSPEEAGKNAALIVALKNNAPKLLAIAKAAKAYAEHHKRYDDPMWTPEDGDAAESRRIHEQLISAVDGVHWEHV